MIHLALQTEYTFQKCYGHLQQIVNQAKDRGDWALGIADKNNTFAHIKFNKLCKSAGIKPIFGVRLDATDTILKSRSKYETYNSIIELVFIAKNNSGLQEIYKLVNTAYDLSYYFPRILFNQVANLSADVLVIAPYLPKEGAILAPKIDYQAISPATLGYPKGSAYGVLECPEIALIKNEYLEIGDKGIYEALSHPRNTDIHTYSQHVLSASELVAEGINFKAIVETEQIAQICNVEIQSAEMLKYSGQRRILDECFKGAIARGIDLDNPKYNDRLQHELEIIKEKDFTDYFLIVSDLIKESKKDMLVGPARGSSAGSLVCYLIGITEIDPIQHELLFERFIDINRFDLPDIDTDFPDHKRQKVIKYLSKKYGKDNVRCIGTVSTLKGRSAIIDFAKALSIPPSATENFKQSLIERSPGDADFDYCIRDTFKTEIGKELLEKYPEIQIVEKIEGHARHAGKHAAGVIVANKPLYHYGGIDSKEDIIMMDKKDAESINLLKIDVLGLRTLSILEETAQLAGFDFRKFYSLPLDDPKVFDIFNNNRMTAVFQFEGPALRKIVNSMGVKEFNDLCAITALARPGALMSGGTEKYIQNYKGEEQPVYYNDAHKRITQDTYGIITYQEQMMAIAREIGNMDWKTVSAMRKNINKKVGEEYYITHYKEPFINGCAENGLTDKQAENLWFDIVYSSMYSFNKSHSVSYGVISYWTAWCKAYHPLEFAAANLNHTKDDESAVWILRDFVRNDGIQYKHVDPDKSDVKWTIVDGQLLGGLTNIDGIGIKKAQEIIKKRKEGIRFTPAIGRKLLNPETCFWDIFPTRNKWADLYENPKGYNLSRSITNIEDIQEPGEYLIIGKIKEVDLRERDDEENKYYLVITIEDDTDTIKCNIAPFKFDELHGMNIKENFIEDETWAAIEGKVREGWRNISVERIADLEKALPGVIKTSYEPIKTL